MTEYHIDMTEMSVFDPIVADFRNFLVEQNSQIIWSRPITVHYEESFTGTIIKDKVYPAVVNLEGTMGVDGAPWLSQPFLTSVTGEKAEAFAARFLKAPTIEVTESE